MSFLGAIAEPPWMLERLPTERFSVVMNDRSDPHWGFDIGYEAILAAQALRVVYPSSKIEIFDRQTGRLSNLQLLASA